MNGLVGGLALAGTLWLVVGYWMELPGLRVGTPRRPWSGWPAMISILGVAALVIVVGPRTAAMTLASLAPTSGGTAWSDPEARLGIGDGPNEVEALEDADSVGFTQSEVYLETDRPSLYDTYSDTFGEPYKKSKQERTMALQADQVEERQRRPTENNRAGREFQVRRRPPHRQRPPDTEADALLYVQGRAPVHLRLVAYDTFDGEAWREGPLEGPESPNARIAAEGPDSPWLRIEGFNPPYLAGVVTHKIKVGLLETRAVPSPGLLTRFRVGSVNRPDFFEWGQPLLPRMAGRTIPKSTVIETEARTVDPKRLERLPFPEPPRSAPNRLLRVPDSPSPRRLATAWTAGRPRGWSQVEALIQGLRHHCEYDPEAVPPRDCPDVVEHFLSTSRKGPAYLFATSAALALRSIGYPTRLVGGYYAAPDRYDLFTRQIPVRSTDAHLWVEVQLPGGVWVPVEPTPGFELLGPERSWLESAWIVLRGVGRWVVKRAAGLSLIITTLIVVLIKRRWLIERLETLAWWLSLPYARPERLVLATLRLLEHRASKGGWRRPSCATPRRWYAAAASNADAEPGRDLFQLLQAADWVLYGPSGRPPADCDPDLLCRRVVRRWTPSNFRALSQPATTS